MSRKISLNGIKIFNAIGFQIGWFVCILKENLFSLALTVTLTLTHLLLIHFYKDKLLLKKEIYWLLIVAVIGFVIETLFFSIGVISENTPTLYWTHIITPPLWMVYLWLLFATSLRTSLSFLFNMHWPAYLLTGIIAPCSYFAGSHLNAHVEINEPMALNLAIISVAWVFALWLLKNIKHFYFEDIFYDN